MTTAYSVSEGRLQHSSGGLLRLSQMQDARLRIYVEGINCDRNYYGQVLSSVAAEHNIKIAFTVSRDIGGGGEGKERCLRLHDELLQKNQLISQLDGMITISLFIVDKDIDDIEGKSTPSQHFLRTIHHSVENHIVRESDIVGALAATIGIDIPSASELIGDQMTWLRSCFDSWKEWIALCILNRLIQTGTINYKSRSQVNSRCNCPTDTNLVEIWLSRTHSASALSRAQVNLKYEQILLELDLLRAQDEHDKVFKGRWYAAFLAELGKALMGSNSFDEKALWAALLSHLDNGHPESEDFRRSVRTMLNSVN
jgi:hypothetical protein